MDGLSIGFEEAWRKALSMSMDDSWRMHGHVDEAMDHVHHGFESMGSNES